MGRRTFESLPRILPGRRHIVLSRNSLSAQNGVTIVRDLHELREMLSATEEEVFLIGGESLYNSLLPDCARVLLTKIDAAAPHADAFFPVLDTHPEWTCQSQSPWQEENGLRFCFCEYKRNGQNRI
jgi:dihydrofolate reductase